ncbi:hypothetical protein GIB67_040086 [Kingdonia uniflora]|uniref:RING-type E3 ubiquitin transferase n=1 Tax=Kingdonia uniflora TaxID=39325 RepID=A0A7J7MUU5_9MAGN|nr:hypothetical protein GIB67_040086 [Kingdonia uniflora]
MSATTLDHRRARTAEFESRRTHYKSRLDLFATLRATSSLNVDYLLAGNIAYFTRHFQIVSTELALLNIVQDGLSEVCVVDGGDICAICWEDLEGDAASIIKGCSHIYHGQCISGWTEIKPTCPLCRHNISVPGGDSRAKRRRVGN